MAYRNRKRNYPLYETVHFDNLRTMTEDAAKKYGDKYLFSYKKRPTDKEVLHYTFVEARDYIRDLATALIAKGMRELCVAIIGESAPEWVFSYHALMSIGAVNVPIDKDLPTEDMLSILKTAGCGAIIFSAGAEKKINALRESLDSAVQYIVYGGSVDYAEKIEDVRRLGGERYSAGDNSYYDYEIDPDRLATIVFTSGTTGKGKGVMLTVRNVCSDMTQGMYNFKITDKTVCVLPPHHTFCSTVMFIGHYALGCEMYISSGLKYVPAELKAVKPTHMILVPLFIETFYKKIISGAEKSGKLGALRLMIKVSNALRKIGIDLRGAFFKKSVLSNFGGELGMIISGGAALNPNIIKFFEDIGVTVLNGYGISECSPLISCNRNEYRRDGSVGMPIIGGHVKIANPDELGEGEICYRGPNVMLGYYENEEATAAAFDEEGYFRTGDYGRLYESDGEQWIYITGRLKNLIILSNGKNVYPEEIETDIQGVYGVGEVVVYAAETGESGGELIVAEIYPDKDALAMHNITDIQGYFDAEIAKINRKNVAYKKVGAVKLRDTEFPKNTSRKITRFKIDKKI